MNLKKQPNHKKYIQILRRMTPEERLMKAFELSEFSRQRFVRRLRKRFPDFDEKEIKKLLLKRLEKKSQKELLICKRQKKEAGVI